MTATVVATTGATTKTNGHATTATDSTAAASVSTAEETAAPAMATPAAPETDGAKQAKIVFVLPEQTPPAVRFVLGRRRGWMEWDAEVHGVDEVCLALLRRKTSRSRLVAMMALQSIQPNQPPTFLPAYLTRRARASLVWSGSLIKTSMLAIS